MRYRSIYLQNYIGIYNGMKLEEIFINFDLCRNNIIVIKGDNGSGKSTLFKAINVLQDDTSMFIRGRSARKIVEVYNNGLLYRIDYIHEYKNGGYVTKGFFYKAINGEYELCNQNGNVTACKELIFEEFGLDGCFASLSELSSKDRGLISKIPSMRKQNFNNIIDGVEAYNQIHKTLSKKSGVYKSLVNSLINKINRIGDENLLYGTLTSLEQRITGLEMEKEFIIGIIAKRQGEISLLDPDNSIQTTYAQSSEQLKVVSADISSYRKLLMSKMAKIPNVVPDNKFLLSLEDAIDSAEDAKIKAKTEISKLIAANEESAKKLREKQARLSSLVSDTNYNTLMQMKADLENDIAQAEAFFTEANIVDTSMTSEEYVDGLNTLKDIKEVVDIMRDSVGLDVIIEAIGLISIDEDRLIISYPDIETIKDSINGITESQHNLEIDLIRYEEMEKIASKLVNRPESCKDNSCFFIKDAVEAASHNPTENITLINTQLQDNMVLLTNLEQQLQRATVVTEAVNYLNQVYRYINGRKRILNKLPNGYVFSNPAIFFDQLSFGSDFNIITEIYKYISEAAMFERYHSAVARLKEVQIQLDVYEAKNEIIEEITHDIDSIQNDIDYSLSQIEVCNNIIRDSDNLIIDYRNKTDIVRGILETDSKFQELEAVSDSITKTMDNIREAIETIDEAKSIIDKENYRLDNLRTNIASLEKERNTIEYGISQLEEYKVELQEFQDKFEKIEFMKMCCSPTKGIQLIFIELYLRDIINTANEILSHVMGGEFRLLKPIIDDRSFNFPCIGDGLPHDDISSLSDGQAAIMSVVLSASITYHSSSKYNILKFDEVDGQLDTANRGEFLMMIMMVMQILQCEQCFTITHNNELDLNNVDLIILRTSDDELLSCGGNVIFNYAQIANN